MQMMGGTTTLPLIIQLALSLDMTHTISGKISYLFHGYILLTMAWGIQNGSLGDMGDMTARMHCMYYMVYENRLQGHVIGYFSHLQAHENATALYIYTFTFFSTNI